MKQFWRRKHSSESNVFRSAKHDHEATKGKFLTFIKRVYCKLSFMVILMLLIKKVYDLSSDIISNSVLGKIAFLLLLLFCVFIQGWGDGKIDLYFDSREEETKDA